MTDPQAVEMLAGGPKPDFFREAVKENTAVCSNCGDEDLDVIYVDRSDSEFVLCADDAEEIPESRLTREYIAIEMVPWEKPPTDIDDDEDIEPTVEDVLKEFKKPNGKFWAVRDSEGEIAQLVSPRDISGNSVTEARHGLGDALRDLIHQNGGSTALATTIYLPGDNRFLISASITVWPIEEIPEASAELFVERQLGE